MRDTRRVVGSMEFLISGRHDQGGQLLCKQAEFQVNFLFEIG